MSSRSNPCPIQHQVPLSRYNTWRVGGTARWLAVCRSREDLRAALDYAAEQRCPLCVLGRGSNVLFEDRGFDGLVLVMQLNGVQQQGPLWSVEAGVHFSRLGMHTARAGWGGLEFAAGIPGSVGGAVYMNAGAMGAETQQVLETVSVLYADGSEETFERHALQFTYRTSPFQSTRLLITGAQFRLVEDSGAADRMEAYLKHRTASQPYEVPSAGCVFRNPNGMSAGALIDRCGLKGLRCGDAQISHQHGNFFVNVGKASCVDLLQLIETVQTQVLDRTGILLETEVQPVAAEGGWCPWS